MLLLNSNLPWPARVAHDGDLLFFGDAAARRCGSAALRFDDVVRNATVIPGPARGGGGTAACERALSLSGVTHELVDDVEYPPSYKPRGGTVSKGANAQTPKGESELIVSPKASPSPVEPPSTAVVERGRCAKAIAMRYIRDLHQHLAAHPDALMRPLGAAVLRRCGSTTSCATRR